jgi:hypothetical protein
MYKFSYIYLVVSIETRQLSKILSNLAIGIAHSGTAGTKHIDHIYIAYIGKNNAISYREEMHMHNALSIMLGK